MTTKLIGKDYPKIYNRPSVYDFIRGQLIVMQGVIEIGENVEIESFVTIKNGVRIGNNVTIKEYTRIDAGANIGDNVQIRGHSVICEDMVIEGDNDLGHRLSCTNHPKLNKFHGIDEKKPPHICRYARIGTDVVLLPGVTIGKNAIVGANSLVTKDVPYGEVWVGSPARKLRDIIQSEVSIP